MNAPLYTIEILRLAASLPDPRTGEVADGRAEARSPTCGSMVATWVRLDRDGGIADLSQTVQACAFGQASAALVERHARGRSRAAVAAAIDGLSAWLSGSEVASVWPEIESLAPARSRSGRHGAILLPFRALLAALDDAR